jgi:GLPGLI family protein
MVQNITIFMKYCIIYTLLICGLFSFVKDNPNYKAVYRINFIPNLATNNIKTEFAILIIEQSQNSSYASENTYRQDSILRLVNDGKLNKYDIMNDKYPKTDFKHFVQKKYIDNELQVSNLIFIDNYIYKQKNSLIWQLQTDTLNIQGYVCHKATTTYEGRNYIAWYTKEIPISDGPYKFWGLPGLIVKIYDTEKHYDFSLESFEKFTEKPYFEPFQTKKKFDVSYEKFKSLNKEFIENPLKTLEAGGIKPIKPIKPTNEKKPNPIERY